MPTCRHGSIGRSTRPEFAVFLLSMLRISQEFGVPLSAVTASFAP